jgi:hypothetical protein
MGTLVSLLPQGIGVSGKSGQDGYASLVADDGNGAAMVEVNVQTGMGDVAGEIVARGDSVTELPGGGKIVVSERAGEKRVPGVRVRTVDVLHEDGRRVVVSAYNAGTHHSAATRARPVLTVAQLKSVATSPAWWN